MLDNHTKDAFLDRHPLTEQVLDLHPCLSIFCHVSHVTIHHSLAIFAYQRLQYELHEHLSRVGVLRLLVDLLITEIKVTP